MSWVSDPNPNHMPPLSIDSTGSAEATIMPIQQDLQPIRDPSSDVSRNFRKETLEFYTTFMRARTKREWTTKSRGFTTHCRLPVDHLGPISLCRASPVRSSKSLKHGLQYKLKHSSYIRRRQTVAFIHSAPQNQSTIFKMSFSRRTMDWAPERDFDKSLTYSLRTF